ncbi:hypothetical protein Hanom_Chr12g01180211 [Helianthus anomalus]
MFNLMAVCVIRIGVIRACRGMHYYGHGRILEELWQGHGPGKFFGCSVNFPHFDRNFLHILCLARACPGFF